MGELPHFNDKLRAVNTQGKGKLGFSPMCRQVEIGRAGNLKANLTLRLPEALHARAAAAVDTEEWQ
ncbi:unnamed protein product, partial [Fusarium graminearum]